jgi:hypothetical protein
LTFAFPNLICILILTEFLKAKQNNKKYNKNKLKKQQQNRERPHARLLAQSQAWQQLCGGIFKTVLAFRMQGRIRQPEVVTLSSIVSNSSTSSCENDKDSNNKMLSSQAEKLRFEHRFMPFFSVITPPAISYQQFHDMCDQVHRTSDSPAQELFTGAFQCFDEAKRILSAIPDPNEEVSYAYSLCQSVVSHIMLW